MYIVSRKRERARERERAKKRRSKRQKKQKGQRTVKKCEILSNQHLTLIARYFFADAALNSIFSHLFGGWKVQINVMHALTHTHSITCMAFIRGFAAAPLAH